MREGEGDGRRRMLLTDGLIRLTFEGRGAMQVENDTFNVVTVGGDRYIYGTEEEAIAHLQENSDDIDVEQDDVSVVEVEVSDGDWTIAEMPWQQIALRLLQED